MNLFPLFFFFELSDAHESIKCLARFYRHSGVFSRFPRRLHYLFTQQEAIKCIGMRDTQCFRTQRGKCK